MDYPFFSLSLGWVRLKVQCLYIIPRVNNKLESIKLHYTQWKMSPWSTMALIKCYVIRVYWWVIKSAHCAMKSKGVLLHITKQRVKILGFAVLSLPSSYLSYPQLWKNKFPKCVWLPSCILHNKTICSLNWCHHSLANLVPDRLLYCVSLSRPTFILTIIPDLSISVTCAMHDGYHLEFHHHS